MRYVSAFSIGLISVFISGVATAQDNGANIKPLEQSQPEYNSIKAQKRAASEESLLPSWLSPQDDSYLTLSFENDIFSNTDRGYTNGVRAAYVLPENALPAPAVLLLDAIPVIEPHSKKRVGFEVGQSMFTPEDISEKALIKDDRPYAGWLYGSLVVNADSGDTFDQLKLTLGIVGSSSLAAQTQDAVHKITNSPDPQGWDNQLHDEPGIVLTYQKAWKQEFRSDFLGFGLDFTPHAGLSLGNVFTHAALGGTMRFGFDLPQDYGPSLISPSITGSDFFVPTDTFGWYLFTTVEGRAVGRNIFLDGNTFKDSHSVDKRYLVGDLQTGIALTYKSLRVAYTHVFRTEEFRQQDAGESYGGITTTFRF